MSYSWLPCCLWGILFHKQICNTNGHVFLWKSSSKYHILDCNVVRPSYRPGEPRCLQPAPRCSLFVTVTQPMGRDVQPLGPQVIKMQSECCHQMYGSQKLDSISTEWKLALSVPRGTLKLEKQLNLQSKNINFIGDTYRCAIILCCLFLKASSLCPWLASPWLGLLWTIQLVSHNAGWTDALVIA